VRQLEGDACGSTGWRKRELEWATEKIKKASTVAKWQPLSYLCAGGSRPLSRERLGSGKARMAPTVVWTRFFDRTNRCRAEDLDQVAAGRTAPVSTSSARLFMLVRRSIDVFWIQRNASGSVMPCSA
jgi:hypothetical protein